MNGEEYHYVLCSRIGNEETCELGSNCRSIPQLKCRNPVCITSEGASRRDSIGSCTNKRIMPLLQLRSMQWKTGGSSRTSEYWESKTQRISSQGCVWCSDTSDTCTYHSFICSLSSFSVDEFSLAKTYASDPGGRRSRAISLCEGDSYLSELNSPLFSSRGPHWVTTRLLNMNLFRKSWAGFVKVAEPSTFNR